MVTTMLIWNKSNHGNRGSLILLLLVCFSVVLLQPSIAVSQEAQQISPASEQKPVRKKMSFKERLQLRKQMQLDNSQSENVVYACPMHPEVTSDKPGKCSKCGMFLVKQPPQISAEQPMQIKMVSESMNMPGDTTSAPMTMDMSEHDHERSAGMQKSDDISMHENMDTKSNTTPHFWDSETVRPDPLLSKTQDHKHTTGLTPEKPLPSIFEPVRHTMPGLSSNGADTELSGKYVCPMHPQIVQDGPGSCPICGMDLVAHKSHTTDTKKPQVYVSAAVIQNMGVRIAPVKMNHLHNHIITQGLVTADDDRITNIHPRTAGWIQKLYLLTEGDRVERKDELVEFYSPWINEIQLEFIAALEEYDMLSFEPERAGEVNSKIDNLINSLRLLNVMDMDIMRIRNTRKVQNTIQLLAPQSGVITDLNIREGTYLEPYQPMFTIVDLSRVWVMIDIYEHQAVSVRKGQQVTITTAAIPSRQWNANIDYIYPEVNPKTRTLKARITVKNPDEALLLNMYVNVDISVSPEHQQVLTVPREAIILTGEREVVIKALDNGHFQPVDITSGLRDNDNVEILSGLNEGDKIVISGQFLIDSESSLQASFLRLAN
jgi:membrane fusion protein, copper/silver efflux system